MQQILKIKQEICCKANIFIKTKEDGTLTHLEGYAIGKTHTELIQVKSMLELFQKRYLKWRFSPNTNTIGPLHNSIQLIKVKSRNKVHNTAKTFKQITLQKSNSFTTFCHVTQYIFEIRFLKPCILVLLKAYNRARSL